METSHYTRVVPLVRFIQGRRRSWFCGAYTMVNTHECATISGLAVAHRLGAPYPFAADPLAKKQFDQYLHLIHGVWSPGFSTFASVVGLAALVGAAALALRQRP